MTHPPLTAACGASLADKAPKCTAVRQTRAHKLLRAASLAGITSLLLAACGGSDGAGDAATAPDTADAPAGPNEVTLAQQSVASQDFSHFLKDDGVQNPLGSPKPTASLDRIPTPSLAWGSCGTAFANRECAVATVPLDYDEPNGPTIQLALLRYPARDKARRIGSLFVNPGGPGGSAVETVGREAGEQIHNLLEGRFDVVGMDPRGVGFSQTLSCFANADDRSAFFARLDAIETPASRGDDRAYYNSRRELTTRCFSNNQKVIRNMSTADVARDMEMMRRAVGDEKLSYLGFSYGSYLGTTYANLFPARVRAVAIDGVLNPVLWSAGLDFISLRKGTLIAANEFMRVCDQAGAAACPLTGPRGAQARYDGLLAALRTKPIVLPDGTRYTFTRVVEDLLQTLYGPVLWGGANGAASLYDALAGITEGVAGAEQRAVNILQARAAAAPEPTPVTDTVNLPTTVQQDSREGYVGNHCSDAAYPSRFSSWQALGDFADAGSVYGAFWWWTNAPCSNWPVSKDRYVGPWTAKTAAPVLVIGGFFDPATDYAGALAVSRLLPNNRLLSYAGWGHVAFGTSACTTQATARYLLAGELPPQGKVCEANPNPFLDTTRAALAESKTITDDSSKSAEQSPPVMLLSDKALDQIRQATQPRLRAQR
jgi:pimeloyl-ACP methyl ester carboxylesterase